MRFGVSVQYKKRLRHFLSLRWIMIAIFVGTVLNLINQYDAIFGNADMHWSKLILTYTVPYFVSSLSAWHQIKQT